MVRFASSRNPRRSNSCRITFTLWREPPGPFQMQLFHPGLFYDRTVRINVVDAHGVRPVGFSPSQFDYGGNDFGSKVPKSLPP